MNKRVGNLKNIYYWEAFMLNIPCKIGVVKADNFTDHLLSTRQNVHVNIHIYGCKTKIIEKKGRNERARVDKRGNINIKMIIFCCKIRECDLLNWNFN
jgi:hypothetical protein